MEDKTRWGSSDVQLYMGGHLSDSPLLTDAPGAVDEGLDRGGGEVGPGAQNHQVCGEQALVLEDGRHKDQDEHRAAQTAVREEVQDPGYTFNQVGRRRTVWRRGCRVRTRPGVKIFESFITPMSHLHVALRTLNCLTKKKKEDLQKQ